MMYPSMLSTFQLDTIKIEVDESDITHLHTRSIIECHSETIEGCVVANTLQRHIHL